MNTPPLRLEGRFIRLEPLSIDHRDALGRIAFDPDLWKWTTTIVQSPGDVRSYIEEAVEEQVAGRAIPFAIIEKSTSDVVGSTRYGNIDRANRRLEIGWTWIARPWQRTAVNTETKYLLLEHAFETLACIRVEFKTDSLNLQSRAALVRIGAKEEGTLRNHMITSTGRHRHTVYYSIVESEWPEVKARLSRMLCHPG